MMLKRKKFVIQCRKFGLKSSCIFKVMNLWSLGLFWLLFDFFINIFFTKIAKKGNFLPAGADMASGSSGELTRDAWDHRTGATRRWGHVAEPWVGHARRTRCGHMAGGHASTRVHMGPRVGHHVAGRVGKWRAHELVGLDKMFGAVMQLL